MKIALPEWQGRISPVFDTARTIILADCQEGKEFGRSTEQVNELVMPVRVRRITELGVNVLLCGAISRPLAGMLASAGIRVIPFLSGETDNVLSAYLNGQLAAPQFFMPGCGRRRGRFRKRCGSRM